MWKREMGGVVRSFVLLSLDDEIAPPQHPHVLPTAQDINHLEYPSVHSFGVGRESMDIRGSYVGS